MPWATSGKLSVTIEPGVAVIITAKDAAATAAKAVRSALAERLATEILFVDDGSSDGTAEVVRACDDGSGRLQVIRLETNRGPAHGRNLAIARSTAPYFCILDADDFFAEGRLEKMFDEGGSGWDLLADEVVFCREMDAATAFDRLYPEDIMVPYRLDLERFVLGNLPHANRRRRELGFLKPIVRRATAERLGVRYDERLRLGEDVLYYAQFLAAGAEFRLIGPCGYCAVQHAGSLSARHRTQDIAALYAALREASTRTPQARALSPYIRTTRHNLALREALDAKRARGWRGFLAALCRRPDCVAPVLASIARDKLGRRATAQPERFARFTRLERVEG
jgi:succinoglycan biosynthesis protein ExoU